VNYEEFMRNLTNEEQQQLMKYLPVVDTTKFPDRLESVILFALNLSLLIIWWSFDVLQVTMLLSLLSKKGGGFAKCTIAINVLF